ncbi:hypothetical protein CBER1_10011 [Cercospora berteroae]|uniref:Zn(2)-C6 fungal-type domain-containing protein n=1 Tax=Cercospora berteroae TaxID=357750 RepID=A0A2S6CID5_9PEZI|nr:hypothetical protein CBER1_10011 [Cercospora berteroae]
MSQLYPTHRSRSYEPYQTSEYDRAIQRAAGRERVANGQSYRATEPRAHDGSHQPPRLPGFNDLFASKLLINPDLGDKQAFVDDRRDSVVSQFDRKNSVLSPVPHHRPQQTTRGKPGSISIQSLCSPQDDSLPSPTLSLSTSPTVSQASSSSLMQPAHHSQPTSPYELPPGFFGTSELAPATYVYQAASSYEGIAYIPGQGSCHMYKGGYSIPTHIFQDPLNLTQSKILRKRLSVACVTCRKKKIKCEPGPDGCLQCKKGQRQCKIEPAKRRAKAAAAGCSG